MHVSCVVVFTICWQDFLDTTIVSFASVVSAAPPPQVASMAEEDDLEALSVKRKKAPKEHRGSKKMKSKRSSKRLKDDEED